MRVFNWEDFDWENLSETEREALRNHWLAEAHFATERPTLIAIHNPKAETLAINEYLGKHVFAPLRQMKNDGILARPAKVVKGLD